MSPKDQRQQSLVYTIILLRSVFESSVSYAQISNMTVIGPYATIMPEFSIFESQ